MVSHFCQKFPELSIQLGISRVKHAVTVDSSFKKGRHSTVPHFNLNLKHVKALRIMHHLSLRAREYRKYGHRVGRQTGLSLAHFHQAIQLTYYEAIDTVSCDSC